MSPVQPNEQKWATNQPNIAVGPALGSNDKNYILKSDQKSGDSFKSKAKSVFDEQKRAPRESTGQNEPKTKPYK